MSARNTPEAKRQRRARRTLRKGRLPAYIDLIEWVKMRSNLSTVRAFSVIMHGALKVDSHTIGVEKTSKGDVFKRYVPASLRGRIVVETPESLKEG